MTKLAGVATAVVLAVGALVATAAPAFAHASFVAASPSPGNGFPQAPGAVGLRFSEPLNQGLSRIEVLDGDGDDVAVGRRVAFSAPVRATTTAAPTAWSSPPPATWSRRATAEPCWPRSVLSSPWRRSA